MQSHRVIRAAVLSVLLACSATALAQVGEGTKAPAVPTEVTGIAGVKVYLLANLTKMRTAATDLQASAKAYDALVGSDPSAGAAAHPAETADLIKKMRDAYERMDSFGYEYVEGIVAGVPSLAKFDNELDGGVPKKGASSPDDVAPIVLTAGGVTIDHEGSLNNYLVEPTVYGTNPKFVSGMATLPGFDKPVNLPNPKLIVALGDYAVEGYARLEAASKAWEPSERDCFQILVSMTPTLAGYFDDWKESRKSGSAEGGRFVAVSRISDMRGIMSSTRLAWLAVQPKVSEKDAALSGAVAGGYRQIIEFIDSIEAREAKGALGVEAIDALGSQAKEKADKLTVQATEAAALAGYPDVKAK